MSGKTTNARQNQNTGDSFEYNTSLGSAYWTLGIAKTLPCSIERIKTYTGDPMYYNKELRDLAWWVYNSNGVITNTVDYMCAIPTLDRIIFSKDKKSKKYKDNKKLFAAVLETIKDKEMIRDSLLKNCNDGVSFFYFETELSADTTKTLSMYDVDSTVEINSAKEINCSLFALPVDYCKIVGIKNSSYQIAFDMSYFNQYACNGMARKLRTYPKEIRDAYKSYNSTTGSNQWHVLDNTRTIVTKVRAKREEAWGRPLALAAFDNIMYSDYFVDTKRNTLDEINNKLVYQEFPEGKDKGTSALTGKQQQEQHDTVKSALNNRKSGQWGLAFVSLAAGSKLNTLDINTDIFDDKNESSLQDKIAGDVGFAASLLNGASKGNYATQQTNLELVSAEIFAWVKQFQTELNKVINAYLIKDTDCYMEVDYLPVTFVNKDKMVRYAKELYMNGKGSLQAWISSCGFNFESYTAMLDDEIEEDLENKYPVHKTSYTLTANDSKPSDVDKSAGRPANDNPTNENTVKSQATAGNKQPKPGN